MSALIVLIVEDDPIACRAYREYADRLDDVTLVGVTGEANKALALIKDHLPQAIILDLELQQGGGSGLDVLRGIQNMTLGVKPFILVATINTDDVIQRAVRRAGASYIISKEQSDYSERMCLDFLCSLSGEIQSRYHSGSARDSDTPARTRERIISRIHAELSNVGIRNNVLGYKYLTDAILLTIDDPGQNVIEIISRQYGKAPINVFHAMQRAIDHAWHTTNIDTLLEHYKASISSEKGVHTVTELVFYYADLIRPAYRLC